MVLCQGSLKRIEMKSFLRLFRAVPNKSLLIIPQAFFYLGMFLNKLVIAVNNGQMPVLFPGGCTDNLSQQLVGTIHTCMVSESHLKLLSDIINLHQAGIWSVGDVLLTFGDVLTGPFFWVWLALALLTVRNDSRA